MKNIRNYKEKDVFKLYYIKDYIYSNNLFEILKIIPLLNSVEHIIVVRLGFLSWLLLSGGGWQIGDPTHKSIQ